MPLTRFALTGFLVFKSYEKNNFRTSPRKSHRAFQPSPTHIKKEHDRITGLTGY